MPCLRRFSCPNSHPYPPPLDVPADLARSPSRTRPASTPTRSRTSVISGLKSPCRAACTRHRCCSRPCSITREAVMPYRSKTLCSKAGRTGDDQREKMWFAVRKRCWPVYQRLSHHEPQHRREVSDGSAAPCVVFIFMTSLETRPEMPRAMPKCVPAEKQPPQLDWRVPVKCAPGLSDFARVAQAWGSSARATCIASRWYYPTAASKPAASACGSLTTAMAACTPASA